LVVPTKLRREIVGCGGAPGHHLNLHTLTGQLVLRARRWLSSLLSTPLENCPFAGNPWSVFTRSRQAESRLENLWLHRAFTSGKKQVIVAANNRPSRRGASGAADPFACNIRRGSIEAEENRMAMTPLLRRTASDRKTGRSYEHPLGFWLGVLLTTTGVVLQLPMYLMAADDHYHLAGMPLTREMDVGMIMIGLGFAVAFRSVFPKKVVVKPELSRIRIAALDDAKFKPAHAALLLVMAAAITIDVMKPTAFAFLAPGASAEYGLKSPLNPHASALPIALYPLSGITGTAIGSLAWGWLADRIGRRAAILLATIVFIGTSCCGTMPEYWMNLVTCFIMGLAAGGMLPIAFALMSETIPKRHRGWAMVLIGSDIAGAYILLSWLASTYAAPDRYGWRLLWLVGLPTGLALLLLNQWIPESPRFLLQHNREDEARAVMKRYGAAIVHDKESDLAVEKGLSRDFGQLLKPPFAGLTAAALLLALSIGMTQYGFQQWMPSNLQRLGFSSVRSSEILRNAALIGFPFSIPIALLYGLWSTKKTVLLVIALMGGSLVTFAILGDNVASNTSLLYLLLVVPVSGISICNAVLAAYTAEIYPTVIRARGSGLCAGMTKFGGVLILALVVAAIAAPSVRMTAAFGALPMLLAVIVLIIYGPETRQKQLERITQEELHIQSPAAAAARFSTRRPVHEAEPATAGTRPKPD
jgi:putative MFS transporter